MTDSTVTAFRDIVDQIQGIGLELHAKALIRHAEQNLKNFQKSIKDLPVLNGEKARSALVISAGPSVHRKKSLDRIVRARYKGALICVDGSYIAALKAGLRPDFVLSLDPHPTRMVRWFGDPEFEKHSAKDDYFSRQDLDVEFRKNMVQQNFQHIELVNKYGALTKAIVASSAPANVIARMREARFDIYGWNPLVDDPDREGSITRQLYDINKMPCMNTGGNVGTAAWVFAHTILKIKNIAVLGMDMGYYIDLPWEQTQLYYELIKHLGGKERLQECFMEFEFPLTKEKFYTDPTYYWYRRNFLELAAQVQNKTFNCTEGGTLFGEGIECVSLESFLEKHQ